MPDPDPDGAAAQAQMPAPPPVALDRVVPRQASPSSGGRGQLTRAQAERVIARALQLQEDAAPRSGEGLTLDDIQDIGAQIGLDPKLIRRAVTDVRLATAADSEPSLTERLLGPRRVLGVTAVSQDPVAVRHGVHAWMTHDEGMRAVGARGPSERWVKDKRLIVGLQRGLQVSRASGVLRDIRAVTLTVDGEPDGTVVEVEADTRNIRATTTAIAVSGLAAGVAIGLANAGIIPDTAAISSDLGQFVVSFGGTAAVALGTAAAVGRRWTTRVREAVDDALDGITMMTSDPERGPPIPETGGWRQSLFRWMGGNR